MKHFGIDTLIWICYKPEGKQAYLYAQWYSELRKSNPQEQKIIQNEGYVRDTKIVETKKELVLTAATDYLPVRKVNPNASLSYINFSEKGLQASTDILF
ncbi:MAG TPA: hypothetical protein PK566_00230 [Pseudobacteroides sp.]|nr:hypothetical protein [Pseudobacteroides sp.]